MANKYCKHKVGSHLRWLLLIVFHWQSSRCDLSRTKRVGRNGIPLRSIFVNNSSIRKSVANSGKKMKTDFADLRASTLSDFSDRIH